jgi:hypothetical protein
VSCSEPQGRESCLIYNVDTRNVIRIQGYYPVFTWVSSMNQLIDTLVSATTGQKAGLSTTPDSQIKQILEVAAIALRKISADIEAQNEDKPLPWYKALYAKVERKAEQEADGDGDGDHDKDHTQLPIVIIDNYLYRESSVNTALWDELAEWAALLVENGIAHVVFVSANVGITKSLGKGE